MLIRTRRPEYQFLGHLAAIAKMLSGRESDNNVAAYHIMNIYCIIMYDTADSLEDYFGFDVEACLI